MASRLVIFDTNSLGKLLTHYSDGEVPLDAEIKNIMSSQYLPSWIAIILESKDWKGSSLEQAGFGGQQPYHFRFEAGRVLNWTDKHDELKWSDEGAIEAPRRTD